MENQVTPPNKVSSAYEEFIEAFRTAVEDANRELSMPGRPLRSLFEGSADSASASFNACLYLKDWPCKRLARNRRLDIAVKALEVFSRPAWLLTKSTVYVSYFLVSSGLAVPVQSLHYDFVDGGQTDHPFFHVHLSDEPIPESDLRNAGCDVKLTLPEASSNECWVTMKIPTPDMTLASVLYCMVADHLGAEVFRQFAENVHSIQDRLPAPGFDALKRSIQGSAIHFKSSHWFAHMREPERRNS